MSSRPHMHAADVSPHSNVTLPSALLRSTTLSLPATGGPSMGRFQQSCRDPHVARTAASPQGSCELLPECGDRDGEYKSFPNFEVAVRSPSRKRERERGGENTGRPHRASATYGSCGAVIVATLAGQRRKKIAHVSKKDQDRITQIRRESRKPH